MVLVDVDRLAAITAMQTVIPKLYKETEQKMKFFNIFKEKF